MWVSVLGHGALILSGECPDGYSECPQPFLRLWRLTSLTTEKSDLEDGRPVNEDAL